MARLDDMASARLGLIIGPVGSGKTTLLAQWAGTSRTQVTWCPASAAEAHLLEINQRQRHSRVVVIDDLHLGQGGDMDLVLEQVLRTAPPNLHLLVASRDLPRLNLARTELSTSIINGDDLRFRSWEVERLFADVYRTPLPSAEDAALLTQRTDGWAAALHLFHQWTAGCSSRERHRRVHMLDGPVRYVRAYVEVEILDKLPKDLAVFLVSTCVFGRLNGRRCDALLGDSGSHQRLLELERRQVLITSDDGWSFRCHPVLRRHLASLLAERLGGEAEAGELYRRAGQVLQTEGAVTEALNAYARAGEWPSVRHLLRYHGTEIDSRECTWASACPDRLAQEEPMMRAIQARRLLDDGRWAEALQRWHRDLAPSRPSVDTDGFRGVAAILGGSQSQPSGLSGQWWALLRQATRRDPAGAAAVAGTTGHGGRLAHALALLLSGDVRSSRPLLSLCADDSVSDLRLALAARLVLGALTGCGTEAVDAVAWEAGQHHLPWLERMARGTARACRVAAGEGAGGEPLADEVHECRERGDIWGELLLLAVRGLALARAGHGDVLLWEQLVHRTRAMDAPVLEAWARAFHALASAATELPDSARFAEEAEAFARRAYVPGASAVAYAALAAAHQERRCELLNLAEVTAADVGLSVRPWTWLSIPSLPHAAAPRSPVTTTTARPVIPSPLTIRCFGRFELLVAGEPADLRRVRPRARALLRLLALEAGRPVHRELMIEALWRDLDLECATHNLHVCVSSLRSALEPGVPRGASRLLVRDGDRYQLVLGEGSSSDLQDFEQALSEADGARTAGDLNRAVDAYGRAVELYTGEVLPEDGPAEWVVGARDHYRMRMAEASATLAELCLARHDPSAATAAALRSIDAEPCRDASWRVLLAAYKATGDVAAAERARRSYADMLASLGVAATSVAGFGP